jgi:type II secretory pathway pseudopilin PulG
MTRLRRLLRSEAGYSLVELVTVMVVLGTVLTALTTVFVQGSKAELDTNRRSQAQLQAIGAFDRLRKDVHCASSATVSGATLTLSGCSSGTFSWCTLSSPNSYGLAPQPANAYALYRKAGSSCDNAGKLYADYLTSSAVFTYTAPGVGSLAKVHAQFVVNVNVDPAAKPLDSFELADDIVLRNSTRA